MSEDGPDKIEVIAGMAAVLGVAFLSVYIGCTAYSISTKKREYSHTQPASQPSTAPSTLPSTPRSGDITESRIVRLTNSLER